MQEVHVLIIGGGVVGLAAAAEIAKKHPRLTVALLERNGGCGREISSRSSEVIHAGIYYAAGSLRARLCVAGSRLLHEFCASSGVAHRRIGKLIVAAGPDEEPSLEELLASGRHNGVEELVLLGKKQVQALEPRVQAVSALWSPSTGIIDSHGLTRALEQRASSRGAALACRHEVTGVQAVPGGYLVRFLSPEGHGSLRARWVVNAAGLGAATIAEMAGITLQQHFCKGEYFRIPQAKGLMVNHLVYPPPFRDLLGLGIHVTKALDGSTRLGPNAFYVDRLDYDVDPGHAVEFYESARAYLPFLELGDLQPDTSGIRAKLQGPGEPARDFYIRHEADHGLPGFINLLGIESPGLTSCLAIGSMVSAMVEL